MAEEYQFVYHHFRRPEYWHRTKRREEACIRYYRGNTKFKAHERGGMTTCYILDESGDPMAVGRAVCSMKDSFCYRLGRRIARSRAVAALNGTEFKPWRGIILGESPTVFDTAEAFFIPA